MLKNFIKNILIFKSIFAICLMIALLIPIHSQEKFDHEKMSKKSKVLACISLTKARISQDVVNIYLTFQHSNTSTTLQKKLTKP